MNLNIPLAQYCVVPAKAGIRLIKKSTAKAGQPRGCVRFAECLFLLGSGLRRDVGLMVCLE